MALQYPLIPANFLLKLPIAQFVIEPSEAVEINETAGGEVLRAELGTALWRGEIALDVMTSAEAASIQPLIHLARKPEATFVLFDAAQPYPRHDPGGSLIAAASPTLANVSPDGRDITIAGLPSGYVLSTGDWIGWTYGANPVRRALHQVVVGATAGAGGANVTLQVTPAVAEGWVTGRPITLSRPTCIAFILPGSVQPGRRKATTVAGVSFRWMQTLGG